MVDFGVIATRLRQLILSDLGLSSPPYTLKVMEDLGGVTVQLFDSREQGGPYKEGKYIAGYSIPDWHDTLITAKAKEAAAAMRADIQKTKETTEATPRDNPNER